MDGQLGKDRKEEGVRGAVATPKLKKRARHLPLLGTETRHYLGEGVITGPKRRQEGGPNPVADSARLLINIRGHRRKGAGAFPGAVPSDGVSPWMPRETASV